ncbi:MAG: hemerythrin domain-containing protein [Thermoplasmata archaeon]
MVINLDELDRLANEHELFEKALFSINCNITKNFSSRSIDRSKIAELLTFLSHFSIDVHFEREEDILFPLLERFEKKTGFAKSKAPINNLVEGHRNMTDIINESISYLENDKIDMLSKSITDLSEIVTAHATLEYVIFFPIIQNRFMSLEQDNLKIVLERFFESKNSIYPYSASIAKAEILTKSLCKKKYAHKNAF